MKLLPILWAWYWNKKFPIKMQVTRIWRGKVNLWDRGMLFRWTGTAEQFKRNWLCNPCRQQRAA